MLYIEDYGTVHKGIKNAINQDNVYLNGFSLPMKNEGLNNYQVKNSKPNNLIYCVFDGIGGLNNGEYASFIGTNILNKYPTDNINNLIDEINTKIYLEHNNMGTTMSLVTIDDVLRTYQIGDSPIYIFDNNKLTKLVEQNSNLLDNYLGKSDTIKVSMKEFKLTPGMKIVICSDGLSKEVSDENIESVLKNTDEALYITQKLLNEALKNGGNDNISIITLVCKYKLFGKI